MNSVSFSLIPVKSLQKLEAAVVVVSVIAPLVISLKVNQRRVTVITTNMAW